MKTDQTHTKYSVLENITYWLDFTYKLERDHLSKEGTGVNWKETNSRHYQPLPPPYGHPFKTSKAIQISGAIICNMHMGEYDKVWEFYKIILIISG